MYFKDRKVSSSVVVACSGLRFNPTIRGGKSLAFNIPQLWQVVNTQVKTFKTRKCTY